MGEGKECGEKDFEKTKGRQVKKIVFGILIVSGCIGAMDTENVNPNISQQKLIPEQKIRQVLESKTKVLLDGIHKKIENIKSKSKDYEKIIDALNAIQEAINLHVVACDLLGNKQEYLIEDLFENVVGITNKFTLLVQKTDAFDLIQVGCLNSVYRMLQLTLRKFVLAVILKSVKNDAKESLKEAVGKMKTVVVGMQEKANKEMEIILEVMKQANKDRKQKEEEHGELFDPKELAQAVLETKAELGKREERLRGFEELSYPKLELTEKQLVKKATELNKELNEVRKQRRKKAEFVEPVSVR